MAASGERAEGARLQAGRRVFGRPELRARVDGVAVVDRGGRVVVLPWSAHRVAPGGDGTWSLMAVPPPRVAWSPPTRLVLRRGHRPQHVRTWGSPVPAEPVAAIVAYLAVTPMACDALDRVDDLVPIMARTTNGRPAPALPPEPAFEVDRHRQLVRALDVVWPRRFGGYPVEGEARPSVPEVLDVFRVMAPSWWRATRRDRLEAMAAEHLAIGGWRFGALVER